MQAIIKKLNFKDSGVVLNAPAGIGKEFEKLGFKTRLNINEKSRSTLVFINNGNEYRDFLKTKLKNIEPDSVLWFAYPKQSSGIKTDINRDSIRVTGEEYGITTVTAVSIDETWSALRFRPIKMVGK